MKTFTHPRWQILPFLLFAFISVTCNQSEIPVKNYDELNQLIRSIESQAEEVVDKLKRESPSTRAPIDDSNEANPYDHYGVEFGNFSNTYKPDSYYNLHLNESYQGLRDGYLNSISGYLLSNGISFSPTSISKVETDQRTHFTYGIEYLLNQAYYQGKISNNTKNILLSYNSYYENTTLDAYEFNEVSVLFENNIISSPSLTQVDKQSLLTLISLAKRDKSRNNSDRCFSHALGGLVIGFLTSGPQGAFIGAFIGYFSCKTNFITRLI